ncbi:nuclear transport factor 2 family protein [Actinophytocola sediminis]
MNDLIIMADRLAIAALVGEFTDAGMQRDYDRWGALFTQDGVWRIPAGGIEFTGREEVRAGIERLQGTWEFFVQNTHPGWLELDGDTGVGRVYIQELGRFRDGSSHANFAIYHDRYRRTPEGWKFAERTYELRYQDDSPLTGTAAKRQLP